MLRLANAGITNVLSSAIMSQPTFFLIDGHALAYRAYFGMKARRFQTRQGLPTGAIFGFTRILFELIRREQPHYLVVCFDTKDPTHRHEAFEDYKGHRKPAPDDLVLQFPYIERMVQALGIPIYRQSGYEADDLLGSLACKASQKDYAVRILTGDRDLFQLIDEQIRILVPSRDASGYDSYGAAEVQAKYGYTPAQVVDFKALAGDSSDNIPGVKGIGEKSALSLLAEHHTLEGIYKAVDEAPDTIPSKWIKKLVEGRESAQLSYQLATIVTDMPVEMEPESAKLGEANIPDLLELMQTLEFNRLQKELPTVLKNFESADIEIETLESFAQAQVLSPAATVVSDAEALQSLVQALQQHPFAFDTETTGLASLSTDLVGLSFAHLNDQGEECCYYVPTGHRLITDLEFVIEPEVALEALKPVLENPDIAKCAHNAKFDCNVLSQYGVQVKGLKDDTMILDYILYPESQHGLKEMALSHLNVEMQPISALIGTGRKKITMDQVSVEAAAPYAAADAVATLRLQKKLREVLEQPENEKLKALYEDIEMPVMGVLAALEQAGILLDTPFLAILSQELEKELAGIESRVTALAGETFNLNSPQQLSKILFENLKLPTQGIKKNKTGAYSTDIKTLEKLSAFHPMLDEILSHRQLAKLKSTYVDAMPLLINPRTHRLHTTFNQTVVATGRLSSSDPNLQNIPVRTELGRQMRKAFIAKPGHVLVSCDYSQVELRLLAHFSEDPAFMQAFRDNLDIHTQTAKDIFDLPSLDDVTPEMRRIAKTTNFGIVYGQTAFGLSRTLNISNGEAKQIIDRFKSEYPGIDRYMESTLEQARDKGYVETLFQRRRTFENINNPNRSLREFSERAAVNAPIQGSASDLIKLAMIRIQHWITEEGLPIDMLLQVHDELVFEMPEDAVDTYLPEILRQMEQVYTLSVPLRVDAHSGINWKEAK